MKPLSSAISIVGEIHKINAPVIPVEEILIRAFMEPKFEIVQKLYPPEGITDDTNSVYHVKDLNKSDFVISIYYKWSTKKEELSNRAEKMQFLQSEHIVKFYECTIDKESDSFLIKQEWCNKGNLLDYIFDWKKQNPTVDRKSFIVA